MSLKATMRIKMETHVSDFVLLSAQKTKLSAALRKQQQDVCKMISAFTRDSTTIMSFVMASAQLNAKTPSSYVQMTPFPTDAPNPKTAFLNKRITKETYAHTNNALSNAQKPDICAKEMLMNTGAKKKMFAF